MRKKLLCLIFSIFTFTVIFSEAIIAEGVPEITIEFDEVGDFHEGMAWIRKGDKYGFIDESGILAIPMIYDAYRTETIDSHPIMNNFSEGLAGISIDGKCGFIDKTGALIIPAIFDGDFYIGEWISYMPVFKDGLARVKKDKKFGYINKSGEIAVPFEYASAGNDYTGFFTEGLIRVSIGDDEERKFGFIDTGGNIVVPLEYSLVLEFSNGLAAVTKDEGTNFPNWGFIDKTGKLVIPFKYDLGDAWRGYSYFNKYGYAVVWQDRWEENEKCGVIDRNGNLIVPYKYNSIRFLSDGTILGKTLGKHDIFRLDDEWKAVELLTAPQTGDSIGAFIFICIAISVVGYKIKRRIK